MATPQVGSEVLDGLDDCEEFAFGDGVVALGGVEAPAVVGNNALRAIVIDLLQARSNSDTRGCVGGDNELAIRAGVHEYGVAA
jgi:hypothetical protein